jgi:hypothetical protein
VFEKGENRKWGYGNIIVGVDLIKVYSVPQWNITMKLGSIINVCQFKKFFKLRKKLKVVCSEITLS